MPLARTCSECSSSLSGSRPGTKTCSNKCRLARSRRLRRSKREEEEFVERNPEAAQQIAQMVRRESPDYVKNVIQNELQPIVRDALTEDTLRAIKSLIGLTPRIVELITMDLESEDPVVRQKAYTLVAKYTVGHPAMVSADQTGMQGQMIVQFGLPRPDAIPELVEAEVEEFKTCDMCGEDKLASEFVAGSDRCQACFDNWRATVMQQFA